MQIKQILLTSSLLSMVAFANPWQLNLNFNTSGELRFQNTSICKFNPNYFKPGWTGGDLPALKTKRLYDGEMYSETAAWRTDLKLSSALKADAVDNYIGSALLGEVDDRCHVPKPEHLICSSE